MRSVLALTVLLMLSSPAAALWETTIEVDKGRGAMRAVLDGAAQYEDDAFKIIGTCTDSSDVSLAIVWLSVMLPRSEDPMTITIGSSGETALVTPARADWDNAGDNVFVYIEDPEAIPTYLRLLGEAESGGVFGYIGIEALDFSEFTELSAEGAPEAALKFREHCYGE